jgi:hypothetical protein
MAVKQCRLETNRREGRNGRRAENETNLTEGIDEDRRCRGPRRSTWSASQEFSLPVNRPIGRVALRFGGKHTKSIYALFFRGGEQRVSIKNEGMARPSLGPAPLFLGGRTALWLEYGRQ